ncbi:MAG: hypothetical protein ACRDKU_07875, partial [Gaiellaceae bacterium]
MLTRRSRRNQLTLVTALAVVVTSVFLVGRASATTVALFGGEDSLWFPTDQRTTTNGQPVGGSCIEDPRPPAGSGAGLIDAALPDQGDAFDAAAMAWVGGTQVGGLLTAAGNKVVFTPVTISGLTAQMEYYALTTQATLRVLLKLTNPTTSTVSVPVEYVNNLGSDEDTAVIATGSGNTTFGA